VLAAAVLAGALLALQSRINGALTTELGSAVVTALWSFSVGTTVLVTTALVTGRARKARLLRGAGLQWWMWLGGLGGALLVASSAAAVPLVGVAPVAVAVVAGATGGGLVVDALGLSPRGRQPLTAARAGGVALAVVGLAVGAVGSGEIRPLLLAVVALAGAATAVQAAANGHLQRVSGDAVVAACVSFLGGTLALLLVTAGLTAFGELPALDWPPLSWRYLGGFGGAAYITLAAASVGALGVLRLTLCTVCGQLLGGLVIDAVAPTTDRPGVRTVVGALLTVLAVVVAGRGARPVETRPPSLANPG
jgi:transporter family-2 protein